MIPKTLSKFANVPKKKKTEKKQKKKMKGKKKLSCRHAFFVSPPSDFFQFQKQLMTKHEPCLGSKSLEGR